MSWWCHPTPINDTIDDALDDFLCSVASFVNFTFFYFSGLHVFIGFLAAAYIFLALSFKSFIPHVQVSQPGDVYIPQLFLWSKYQLISAINLINLSSFILPNYCAIFTKTTLWRQCAEFIKFLGCPECIVI